MFINFFENMNLSNIKLLRQGITTGDLVYRWGKTSDLSLQKLS